MTQFLKKQLKPAAALFMVLLLLGSCFGQAKNQQGLLDSVPDTWRAQLLERLNSFLEDYRTQQWDKLYDLIDYDFNEGTREEFVSSRHRDLRSAEVLIDFVPHRIRYRESKEWAIDCCSKWQKVGEVSATVYAYRHNDKWYFTPIALETAIEKTESGWRGKPNNTIPCKP
jgi:hypothetical protein